MMVKTLEDTQTTAVERDDEMVFIQVPRSEKDKSDDEAGSGAPPPPPPPSVMTTQMLVMREGERWRQRTAETERRGDGEKETNCTLLHSNREKERKLPTSTSSQLSERDGKRSGDHERRERQRSSEKSSHSSSWCSDERKSLHHHHCHHKHRRHSPAFPRRKSSRGRASEDGHVWDLTPHGLSSLVPRSTGQDVDRDETKGDVSSRHGSQIPASPRSNQDRARESERGGRRSDEAAFISEENRESSAMEAKRGDGWEDGEELTSHMSQEDDKKDERKKHRKHKKKKWQTDPEQEEEEQPKNQKEKKSRKEREEMSREVDRWNEEVKDGNDSGTICERLCKQDGRRSDDVGTPERESVASSPM